MIFSGVTDYLDMNKLGENNNPTYEYWPPKEGAWPRDLELLKWAYRMGFLFSLAIVTEVSLTDCISVLSLPQCIHSPLGKSLSFCLQQIHSNRSQNGRSLQLCTRLDRT